VAFAPATPAAVLMRGMKPLRLGGAHSFILAHYSMGPVDAALAPGLLDKRPPHSQPTT
jgi:hypothetical protein